METRKQLYGGYYCAETNMAAVLGAQAEHDVVWEPNHLDLLPYLQETPDILAGCQQMAHFEHDNAVCSDILFCRLLEMLVAHGIGSALCQQLLQHEGIQRALACCRSETRALAQRCEAPFLHTGVPGVLRARDLSQLYSVGASPCSDQCPGAGLSCGSPRFPGLVAAGARGPARRVRGTENRGPHPRHTRPVDRG